ncbi:hypothetical protein SeLEV6574_g04155 [Synchytrium endobioticum]|uniref:Exonuclease domain-containing protein n=1 Tax=Synchytrium endobioticum TaxID=286115 RepID=A0A507D0R6_9FUNG|nr:hypothetical protein SeLEV6574_g04155 [Synchytrium endobioticum]
MFSAIPCPHGRSCVASPCPFKHDTYTLPPPPPPLLPNHQLSASTFLSLPSVFAQSELPSRQLDVNALHPISVPPIWHTWQSPTPTAADGRASLQSLLAKIQTSRLPHIPPLLPPHPPLSNPQDSTSNKRDYNDADIASNSSAIVSFLPNVKRTKIATPSATVPCAARGHGAATSSHESSQPQSSLTSDNSNDHPANGKGMLVTDPVQQRVNVSSLCQSAPTVIKPIKDDVTLKGPKGCKSVAAPTRKNKNVGLPTPAVKKSLVTESRLLAKIKGVSPTVMSATTGRYKSPPSQSKASTKPQTKPTPSTSQKLPTPPNFKQQIAARAAAKPQITLSVNSKVPHKTRQNVLNALFTEFQRIYAPILAHQPLLAHEHALTQESKIHTAATNKSYVGSGLSVISRLKQRPVALDDTDIGLDGEWIARPLFPALHPDQLRQYCVQPASMEALGYPIPASPNKQVTTVDVNAPQECARCGSKFTPHPVSTKEDQSACKFHWGAVCMEKANKGMGARRVYTCCHEIAGTAGCVLGPHVFKIADYTTSNAYIPYTRLPPRDPNHHKEAVMALDAEMSYTTAGMELTRFSGVDAHHIEAATFTLGDVHEWMLQHADQDTILVGHGLENDLIAMRLVHDKVVDTADLFKHRKGLPYRHSLKHLTTRLLGEFIQQGIDSHDPVEDAKAALALVRLRVEKGKNHVFTY